MPRVPSLTDDEIILERNVQKIKKMLATPKTWSEHKEKWSSCTNCSLCKTRSKVVLVRGTLPCTVLVIGEAPGQSEDVLGKPFVGNAGKLLDEIIQSALSMCKRPGRITMAFTNLVGCIPLEADKKSSEPSKESIKACAPRLQELVNIAKPKAIIMAGKLSQKTCPTILDYDFQHSLDIIHPTALIRLDASQYPLAIQRTVVSIRDLFNQITEA